MTIKLKAMSLFTKFMALTQFIAALAIFYGLFAWQFPAFTVLVAALYILTALALVGRGGKLARYTGYVMGAGLLASGIWRYIASFINNDSQIIENVTTALFIIVYGAAIIICINWTSAKTQMDAVKSPKQSPTQKLLGIALIASAIGLLAYFYDYAGYRTEVYVARLFGHGLFVLLLALLLRKVLPSTKSIPLLVTIGSIGLAGAISLSPALSEKGEEGKIAISKVENLLDELAEGGEISVLETTENNDYVEVIRNSIKEQQNITQEYLDTVLGMGFDNMVNFSSLSSETDATVNIVNLNGVIERLPKYADRMRAVIAKTRETLSKIDSEVGRSAYKGFLQNKAAGVELIDQYYFIQKEVLISVRDLQEFYRKNYSSIQEDQDQIFLATDQLITEYDDLIKSINDAYARQDEYLNARSVRIRTMQEKLQSGKF